MGRCRHRTSSKELIKLIKENSELEMLGRNIAYKIISMGHELTEKDECKLDDFRNHRNVDFSDVIAVYVQAMFTEVGNSLPDKYVVDYD